MTEADDVEGPRPEAGPSDTAPLKPEVSADRFATLSPQERRLLNLVADGLTDREIGDRLSIPERAVGKYVEDMLSKLGLQTRTQAVLFAINRTFQSADPSRAPSADEPE
ncbi:MAG TPA: helix-turn-helix transcriptional regulator [Actinomycetota bacterium]|jgi:DNA-binding NarL/FixJ family response regulator|nr:helix-turn-helix transcriptional regulator [Actinomycetota bacterium]